LLSHEWCERKNLRMAFVQKDLPVLENSKAVNNPVFIPLSWDNFQVHCRTLLITQPKHVICQFSQYIYHSKTHILGYVKETKQIQILCKYCYTTQLLWIQSGSDNEKKTSLIHWSQFLQGNNVNKIPQTCIKGLLNHRRTFHMSTKSHILL
jgi:hypothetical protein